MSSGVSPRASTSQLQQEPSMGSTHSGVSGIPRFHNAPKPRALQLHSTNTADAPAELAGIATSRSDGDLLARGRRSSNGAAPSPPFNSSASQRSTRGSPKATGIPRINHFSQGHSLQQGIAASANLGRSGGLSAGQVSQAVSAISPVSGAQRSVGRSGGPHDDDEAFADLDEGQLFQHAHTSLKSLTILLHQCDFANAPLNACH